MALLALESAATTIMAAAGVQPDVYLPRRVLRRISGYCLDKWNYKYIDGTYGPYGTDHTKQFSLSPGAFDESLARGGEVILTHDLSGGPAFARVSDGTLRLKSDGVGLLVEADLIDTPRNRWLIQQIDDGKIRGWSHGFEVAPGDCIDREKDGITLTQIYRAILHEVCVVIAKKPRQRERTTPVFLQGGPQQAKTPGATIVKHCCCQTVESGGDVIHVCAEMLASECASLGGNFLGAGTRCWLEGCAGCSVDCNTFCDTYSLHVAIAGNPCIADPPLDFTQTLTRNGGGGGPCTWYGEFGVWSITLTIDTGTNPPTRTLHIEGLAADTNTTIVIDAEQTGDAYCEAPNVLFHITDWDSVGPGPCSQPADADVTLLLTQLADCPDFLP